MGPPQIRVQHVATRSTSLEDLKHTDQQTANKSLTAQAFVAKRIKNSKLSNSAVADVGIPI